MDKILEKLIDYLKEKVPSFEIDTKAKPHTFTCPFCGGIAHLIPNTPKGSCLVCTKNFNIIEVVRILEPDKNKFSDSAILDYLSKKYMISLLTAKEILIYTMLNFYSRLGFDLVPIAVNDKAPIEKDWTHKNHKDKEEWARWIFEDNTNIGVKTGKISNITVVDIDTKDVPAELVNSSPIVQITEKGYHYVFQYDPELPTTRITDLKIDILNDGKQFVVVPSVVNDKIREWQIIGDINNIVPPKIPDTVKKFLLSKMTIYGTAVQTQSEQIHNEIETEAIEFDVSQVSTGNRNNFLISYGGILRKELNRTQTERILKLTNKCFIKPPLSDSELQGNILSQLDKYTRFDEKDLAGRILNYLRLVEEATSVDIKATLGEDKEKIEKALGWLVKEGYILKRRRIYHLLKKVEWKDDLNNYSNNIDFKVPFFHDVGYFNWGDMILLGSKAKWGKTTISVNMLKSLVEQGRKPYYICLETGSRFMKTAAHLKMKSGDFYWDFQTDPTKIELEKNAITIIDWLMIEDKAQTDSVMLRFVDQLYKTNGFLIVFMQLKKDGTWFAPNMVDQFPCMASRYLYENEQDGKTGHWHIDVIREPKLKQKTMTVFCEYDWDTKILSRVDEGLIDPTARKAEELLLPIDEGEIQ
jgi:hypothetical protein